MKFSALQQDLLPPLQSVARSVGVRSTLPVLDNILLSSEGNRLKLVATNLEIGVVKYAPAEILQAGEITVPAKVLVELISGLKQTKVKLESDSAVLYITTERFKASINGIPSSEFPVIPIPEGEGVKFDKEALLSCSQILFAAAVDEGRPILTGVLTEVRDGVLNLVATDGFRLAHRRVGLKNSKIQFRNLIPRRTLEEVIRMMGEEVGGEKFSEVEIVASQNQNQVIFKVGQSMISSRLIEGQFPAWEKIIPADIKTRVVVDKEEILKALKLAAVFTRSESNVVTLKISAGQFLLESAVKELGSQENEVEAQVEGEKLEIAFSSRFLLDAVSNTPASQLVIEFSGPLSPTLIKPMGLEGLEFLVMPVRLG